MPAISLSVFRQAGRTALSDFFAAVDKEESKRGSKRYSGSQTVDFGVEKNRRRKTEAGAFFGLCAGVREKNKKFSKKVLTE